MSTLPNVEKASSQRSFGGMSQKSARSTGSQRSVHFRSPLESPIEDEGADPSQVQVDVSGSEPEPSQDGGQSGSSRSKRRTSSTERRTSERRSSSVEGQSSSADPRSKRSHKSRSSGKRVAEEPPSYSEALDSAPVAQAAPVYTQEEADAYVRHVLATPATPATPWEGGGGFDSTTGVPVAGLVERAPFDGALHEDGEDWDVEKGAGRITLTEEELRTRIYDESALELDVETQRLLYLQRPIRKTNYYTQYVVVLLIIASQANFAYKQITAILETSDWIRLINVAWILPVIIFMLFSIQFALNQCISSLGPIAHMQTNSQYFSAIAPPRPVRYPKITIQMPVYREGLESVILPSIISIEAAMLHYRKAGGKANIFINDDGLQLISEKEKAARIHLYNQHQIAYVARPPHSVRVRKGLFKKASNMNYALNVVTMVEELMETQKVTDPQLALECVRESMEYEFDGAGDVRVGEIILLVDCDTRVPEDCLSKVVGEFELCPDLGFLQCRTTPLRGDFNYWEDMIAHFTENIYDIGIAMSVSSGDPSPLVGHNAFLRWDAVRSASWIDKSDQERKFWSESHVSEDFDMSLRLQTHGYIGRYAIYTGAGFQEGVSLTAADEVIRLRKYAYGACEMLLNPFKDWLCKGLITKMFWSYLTSSRTPWPSKFQMVGYLGTYLAMAYSIIGIIVYIAIRMVYPSLQEQTSNTFDIFMTVLVLFGGIGTFGAGTIRYRLGYSSGVGILRAWFDELKYVPAMTIFWSHVLWHITTACWAYFFSRPIHWGSTVKEATDTSFWFEIKATFQRYKHMYLCLILIFLIYTGAMIYTKEDWSDYRLVYPIAFYIMFHLTGPFILNPVLLRGYY